MGWTRSAPNFCFHSRKEFKMPVGAGASPAQCWDMKMCINQGLIFLSAVEAPGSVLGGTRGSSPSSWAPAPASVWSFRTVVISFLFIIVLSLKGICQVIPGLQSLGLLSGQINFCGNPLCLRYHLGNVGLMESLYNTLCSALLGEGSGAAEAQITQIKPLHFGGLWGDFIFFYSIGSHR